MQFYDLQDPLLPQAARCFEELREPARPPRQNWGHRRMPQPPQKTGRGQETKASSKPRVTIRFPAAALLSQGEPRSLDLTRVT